MTSISSVERDFIQLPLLNTFLDTISLQEGNASSEVENIITTNDEPLKSLVANRKIENTATKEV